MSARVSAQWYLGFEKTDRAVKGREMRKHWDRRALAKAGALRCVSREKPLLNIRAMVYNNFCAGTCECAGGKTWSG